MLPFGLHFACISTILAIVKVKHVTALQEVLYEQDMPYDGVVPYDEYLYMKSFTRVSRTRCCVNCKHARPICAGVLYNREQKECKLLKRYLTEAEKVGDITHEEWEYWKFTKDFNDDPYCKRSTHGWDYNGKINVTISGRTCQVWASQSPHYHTVGTDLPENYCRNPDSEPMPWCYTTDPDKRLEFCDIPMCVTPSPQCLTKQDPTGISYFGTQNVADTGDLCQRWDSQSPHAHRYRYLADQGSYCRNPEGYGAPWCYTVNPNIRWRECIVPRC